MRCLVTSSRPYDQESLHAANQGRHEFSFVETPLREDTAVIARGYPAVCPSWTIPSTAPSWRPWPKAAPGFWPCAARVSTMWTCQRRSA